jgi:predicted nucleotidyltransferase
MQQRKTIVQTTLHETIRHIVAVAQPEKIILFGSAAREEMGPNSDIDLLVIKSGANRLELTGQMYLHMHGVGEAVDIVVVTPEDVERYRNSHTLVIAPALREGCVVYAAERFPPDDPRERRVRNMHQLGAKLSPTELTALAALKALLAQQCSIAPAHGGPYASRPHQPV